MAGKSSFDEYLAQEVQRSKGVYFPVRTGLLRRMLTHKAETRSLHPNPEDEFCMPEVGPSYRIINNYQEQYRSLIDTAELFTEIEPVIVERTHPDGYMILNGHHRWAAALLSGLPKLPIRIVNLMHEADVRIILEQSTHTKRVALDLDEVVFCTEADGVPLEAPLPFPWNRVYKERVRLGIPALFHFMAKNGYDIWLYSSQYHSVDAVQDYFRRYHVQIAGVISAFDKVRKAKGGAASIEKEIANKYLSTVHIDNDLLVQTDRGSKDFREFALDSDAENWSQSVMDAIEKIEREDGEQA